MPQPLLVSEFSAPVVFTVTAEESVEHAYALLLHHRISALLVMADAQAVGVISRRDLLAVARVTARVRHRPAGLELPQVSCRELMSHPVVQVSGQATVSEAARVMVERKVHRVFVTGEDGQPHGVFSSRDAMAAVRAARVASPIASFATAQVEPVEASTSLSEALASLERNGRSLVVLDDGLPVGVFGDGQAIGCRGVPGETHLEEVMEHSLVLLPSRTPMFRAASFAMSTAARCIGAVDSHHHIQGILTGLDFCRALLAIDPEPLTGVAAG